MLEIGGDWSGLVRLDPYSFRPHVRSHLPHPSDLAALLARRYTGPPCRPVSRLDQPCTSRMPCVRYESSVITSVLTTTWPSLLQGLCTSPWSLILKFGDRRRLLTTAAHGFLTLLRTRIETSSRGNHSGSKHLPACRVFCFCCFCFCCCYCCYCFGRACVL